jgi:hypothetical protein
MKNYRASAMYVFAAVLLTGMAVAQNANFVRPVPQCGRPVLEDGDTLFIDNACGISVTVFYTSSGDIWGGKPLGPWEHGRTAYSGEAVRRVGGVHTYTCPGDATPVALDGGRILDHYAGQYRCSGSGQAQNNAMPNDAWRNTVTPSGQAQEAENASQESSADQAAVENTDDNQGDQDAETNQDATDQFAAMLRQNQQTLQNMRNLMQNNVGNQASPARNGGRVQTGQCSGARCY